MAKQYSAAKQYILQAKHRLMHNTYADYFMERKASFYLNNKKISREQYEEMCRKIKEIAASEEFVSDTLNLLVPDRQEFNKLDESNKVKYMLELSKVYTTIKKSI